MPGVHRLGVISDTHSLLRPEALQALAGVELIIHAGDVGSPLVLKGLVTVAPVVAVRGNVDRSALTGSLPETEVVSIGEARLFVLHDLEQLDLDPAAAGFGAVISGHSHAPVIRWLNGVLYLNPGSAGPRRFRHPVSLARLKVDGKRLTAELVELEIPGDAA